MEMEGRGRVQILGNIKLNSQNSHWGYQVLGPKSERATWQNTGIMLMKSSIYIFLHIIADFLILTYPVIAVVSKCVCIGSILFQK
jgi:hypothetical protein